MHDINLVWINNLLSIMSPPNKIPFIQPLDKGIIVMV